MLQRIQNSVLVSGMNGYVSFLSIYVSLSVFVGWSVFISLLSVLFALSVFVYLLSVLFVYLSFFVYFIVGICLLVVGISRLPSVVKSNELSFSTKHSLSRVH